MTPDEIRTAILADTDLQALVPDTVAIASALSVNRKKLVPTEVGNGTILEVLGLSVGNALLDLLTTSSSYRYVKPLLEQGRLRLDSAYVLSTLDSLVGVTIASGITFSSDNAQALKDKAYAPDPVSEFNVRLAIFNNDGTLRV